MGLCKGSIHNTAQLSQLAEFEKTVVLSFLLSISRHLQFKHIPAVQLHKPLSQHRLHQAYRILPGTVSGENTMPVAASSSAVRRMMSFSCCV